MATTANFTDFNQVFEVLINDLVADEVIFHEIPGLLKRLETFLRYNVPYLTEHRGYIIPAAYKDISNSNDLNTQQVLLSYVLGWCWQMQQTHFDILDDHLDDNKLRNGKPTWFYQNDNKPIAINDTVLFQHSIFRLLHMYFGTLPIYSEILKYFSGASYQFLLGQSSVYQMTISKDPEMTEFTLEKYRENIKYKNLKHQYLGAFELALILAGKSKEVIIQKRIQGICKNLAYFASVRTDLRNCFGDVLTNLGKCGSDDMDIKLGKCTWLIIKAKEECNSKQWHDLKEAYGKDDSQKVNLVKDIFWELRLPHLCKKHLKNKENKLKLDIEEIIKEGNDVGNILLEFFTRIVENKNKGNEVIATNNNNNNSK